MPELPERAGCGAAPAWPSARSDFIPGQHEPDVVEAYVRAALAADPRSPNGTIVDILTKLPLLDPEKITVPTMVLRPEKDFASTPEEMLEFFARLKTPDKSYVALPAGGHAIILEKGHRRCSRRPNCICCRRCTPSG